MIGNGLLLKNDLNIFLCIQETTNNRQIPFTSRFLEQDVLASHVRRILVVLFIVAQVATRKMTNRKKY